MQHIHGSGRTPAESIDRDAMAIEALGHLHGIQRQLFKQKKLIDARNQAIEEQRLQQHSSLPALLRSWSSLAQSISIDKIQFSHLCPLSMLDRVSALKFPYPDEWLYAVPPEVIKLKVIDAMLTQATRGVHSGMEGGYTIDAIADCHDSIVKTFGASAEAQRVATLLDILKTADQQVRAVAMITPGSRKIDDAVAMARHYCRTTPSARYRESYGLFELPNGNPNPFANRLLAHSFSSLLADDLVSSRHAEWISTPGGHARALLLDHRALTNGKATY